MKFEVDSRLITLVGTPLAQSFAARMQNAGFAARGLDIRYCYNEAGTERLGEIVDGIRYMPVFAGAAITRPNKVAVMKYLDEIDPFCRKVGACNTIVKSGEKLVGYNTDAAGFMRSLEVGGYSVSGRAFFCIGAGGVGRPICMALAEAGAGRILITDLYEENSKQLADDVNSACAPVAEAVAFGQFDHVETCDCVINASGVGMGALIGQTPMPAQLMRSEQFFFDACYNPAKTRFLLDAEACGAKTLNGLDMSLFQGAAQHKLWTGGDAPAEAMRAELMTILAEREGE